MLTQASCGVSMETDSLASGEEPVRLPGSGGKTRPPFAAVAPPPLLSPPGRLPGKGALPVPPGTPLSGEGMQPGIGKGGMSVPSPPAASRGGPPASVRESTLYGFGGECDLSACP